MKQLMRNWRIWVYVLAMLVSFYALTFNGLRYGVDFSGGTMFQVQLAEKAKSPEQMAQIEKVIEKRLDWTGLKDTKVSAWGDEFVVAQIAETDPARVEELESLLRKQGKFEATLDGQLLFDGSELTHIPKDPAQGYGFSKAPDGLTQWSLPFYLKDEAAKRFSQMSFHKCIPISYTQAGGRQYDCQRTYFFIDRPVNSILLIPKDLYLADRETFLRGSQENDIPPGTSIDELLKNTGVPYVIADNPLTQEQLDTLKTHAQTARFVILPGNAPQELVAEAETLGLRLKKIAVPKSEVKQTPGLATDQYDVQQTIPWTWIATGTRSIISLSPDVASLDPYVEKPEDAKEFNPLLIRGSGETPEIAEKRLKELTIILESGSLPIPVESVSKETISSFLGKEFLGEGFWIGLVGILTVAIVLTIRYRRPKLIGSMMMTVLSETYLTLGFAALIKWNLDLASIAGILAAVGMGVNDQIIITDELLHGGERTTTSTSFAHRIKKAFFIVVATASTMLAAMTPILFIGFGRLTGFAITTIAGVLIGILITRPAFGEVARLIVEEK